MASHRRARKELGHHDKADEIVRAAKVYLVREDGLKERWHGRIWANPPYGEVDQMHWHLSYRTDPLVKPLADRHYNRQNPDSPNFVPPGRCVVLRTKSVMLSGSPWHHTLSMCGTHGQERGPARPFAMKANC